MMHSFKYTEMNFFEMWGGNENNIVASKMPVLWTPAAVEALQGSVCNHKACSACDHLGLEQLAQETDFKDQLPIFYTKRAWITDS